MDAIFLKLDNIKGESQVEGFEDQIEIMSYSHNVAMQVNNDISLTERTSGRAHVGEMSLTKFVDLATPVLNEYCCSGRLIRTAVLTLCHNDGGKMRSLIVYTLTNVLISQLSVSGGAGGKPVETMSLNFTKIKWQITAEKSDSAQQESRTSVWDLAMDQIGK
ncbi:Hcp family type VI secretion system effector [Salmonella enterica]|uniref:Type VI secretion system tube protein Hcp n=1 Tax=Salmonella enterica subsp. enterica serovar Kouka TaxID=2564646 RepID=A0A729L4B1_SALET|nr:Hcp family type VI secretion system effector [Salmonella enterica]EBU2366508.1 type VI secretion system tube protein Hcp [Salmonella enterica subsp. enterica]EBV7098418.1 Hcp1 family type VI secretion system effector [Salmonella enterica subsp. enterica serovar Havana]EEB7258514.1 type VI secretion system tube protein Hcp [Salmonella enterica subsp. enterica serovar Senftenberg]EEJ6225025.1 type VI secretion system tube protein Hcp [Salmonella enterica subsp. enterica serovar Southbank]EHF9